MAAMASMPTSGPIDAMHLKTFYGNLIIEIDKKIEDAIMHSRVASRDEVFNRLDTLNTDLVAKMDERANDDLLKDQLFEQRLVDTKTAQDAALALLVAEQEAAIARLEETFKEEIVTKRQEVGLEFASVLA